MTTEIKQRVAAGVAWLDAIHAGWEAKIDLKLLNMCSCLKCILGQLFGDFCEVIGEWDECVGDPLFSSAEEAAAHGFQFMDSMNEYFPLEDEWRRVIAERQSQPQ